MQSLQKFFTKAEETEITSAIQLAESRTSGEIRVRIERTCGKDPMACARKAFEILGMRNTEQRNGVLFVLAVEDRTFVVLGDDGINERVPDDFWNDVKDVVLNNFRKGFFVKGLMEGIDLAGKQLAQFFPCKKDDVNELVNAISYSEGNVEK